MHIFIKLILLSFLRTFFLSFSLIANVFFNRKFYTINPDIDQFLFYCMSLRFDICRNKSGSQIICKRIDDTVRIKRLMVYILLSLLEQKSNLSFFIIKNIFRAFENT